MSGASVRLADYLMNRLVDQGVKHIFTVTGRGALFLTDGLARNQDLISVSVHHEQSAAFAAVAYAQYNQSLSACLVSTGCAATNTITGVLSAWQDCVPCIFISGQNLIEETTRYTGVGIRTYGQQEADIVSIVSPITKYAVMITDPQQIGSEIDKAIYYATTGKKGPVWIDIPLDLQSSRIIPDTLPRCEFKSNVKEISEDDVSYVINALKISTRPVILVGSGIRSANAINLLDKFITKNNIPLTYTASAPDIFPLTNDLSIGSVGAMGCSRAGNFTIQNCDLLIVLGSRLTSMVTGTDFCKFAREAKVIIIDFDENEFKKKTIQIDRFINADLNKFLSELSRQDIKIDTSDWVKKVIRWKSIFPKCEITVVGNQPVDLYYLTQCISELAPDNSMIVTDSGLIEVIMPTNLDYSRGKRAIHPIYQGSMGYALPASIGAYYSSQQPTIAIVGDGSIMMNLQELQTIHYNKLPIKIIVVNNGVYSIIRRRQKDLFRNRTIGTDDTNGISCPDFKKVAYCFDLGYMKIENNDDLPQGLIDLFQMPGPVICEVIGYADQGYIEIARAFNSNKRLVQRPLEDQSPFLPRDLFLKEMIVESIDQ
jgi:acetolactate synthase-1/2/3 large subunit